MGWMFGVRLGFDSPTPLPPCSPYAAPRVPPYVTNACSLFVDLDVLTLSRREGVLSLGEARLGDRRIEGEVHRGLCAIGPNRGG